GVGGAGAKGVAELAAAAWMMGPPFPLDGRSRQPPGLDHVAVLVRADHDAFRRRRLQELDDLASFELVHFTGEAYQDLPRYPTNCGPNSGNFWRGLLGLGVGDVRRHAGNRHHQMEVAAEGVDAPHVPSEKRRARGVREI